MSSLSARVAVVDDDAAVLASVQFLLEVEGHFVAPFTSGVAFLKAVETARFDCLILDQHMPKFTGLELAQRLHDKGMRLPTMLFTGASTAEIEAEAAAMGLAGVVEKPVAGETLTNFIERVLTQAA